MRREFPELGSATSRYIAVPLSLEMRRGLTPDGGVYLRTASTSRAAI